MLVQPKGDPESQLSFDIKKLTTCCLPSKQAEFAWSVFVHDDPKGECDGTEEEGAHGEGQIQHLILFFTDEPPVHPQVVLWML